MVLHAYLFQMIPDAASVFSVFDFHGCRRDSVACISNCLSFPFVLSLWNSKPTWQPALPRSCKFMHQESHLRLQRREYYSLFNSNTIQ